MPAPPLSNTFESGQASGTTITVANSGGGAGDAFSAVDQTPTYDNTHVLRGTLAMKFDTTATFLRQVVEWTSLGSITTSVYFRAYLYMTAYPVGADAKLFCARTPSGNSAFVNIKPSGVVDGMDASQTGNKGTGTVGIGLNQWVRIEGRILSSTTVGEIEWWLYNTPDASIASFDDHGSATGLVLGASTDGFFFGPGTVTGPSGFVGWFDDIAVSTVSQIGPSIVTTQTIRPDSDVSAGSWTTSPLFSKINDQNTSTVITGIAS